MVYYFFCYSIVHGLRRPELVIKTRFHRSTVKAATSPFSKDVLDKLDFSRQKEASK